MQLRIDLVVEFVRALQARFHGDAEDFTQLLGEPQSARCAAKVAPPGAECPPDRAGVCLNGQAVAASDAEAFEAGALRHEHAGDVVIGDDEQTGWISEWLVVREHRGLDVAVHADQRKIPDLGEDLPRNRSRRRIAREDSVIVKNQLAHDANRFALGVFSQGSTLKITPRVGEAHVVGSINIPAYESGPLPRLGR